MAIRRGGPPKTPNAGRVGKTTSAVGKTKSTRPAPTDVIESGSSNLELPRTGTAGASMVTLGRALVELEREVAKLDHELGKLLEVFAASDSEAKLWTRLKAQRKRLDDARRRWNRVRRRRHELQAAFTEAPLEPSVGARLEALERSNDEGERFEQISAQLAELLAGPAPAQGRRRPAGSERGPANTALLDLASAMIELLRPGTKEA